MAHLPSGQFTANADWLVCAAIAFNLTRAAGCLASRFHAKATTATLRAQLIIIPARIARSARRLVLHLPTDWPWEHLRTQLFTQACGPPPDPDLTTQPPRRNRRHSGKAGQTGRSTTPTPPNNPTKINYAPLQTWSVDPG